MSRSRWWFVAAAAVVLGACHRQQPTVVAATPATRDDGAATRAREDSIRRADAARRDSIARANARTDSLRRAADAARAAEADARRALVSPLFFEFDQSDLTAEARALLDRKANILAANPGLKLRIEGNADDRGSDEYNLALGMRRATQALRYLSTRGIDSSRVTITSNGEERPNCQDAAESCWSTNRRAEFVITAGGDRLISSR